MIVPYIPAYQSNAFYAAEAGVQISEVAAEVVFEQAEEVQVSELCVEIVLEEV